MPDLYLSKVRLNGNTYHLKDSESRVLISNLSTPPLATPTSDGLMSAQDKQTLDNLNPNVTVTLTNINASEVHTSNAKQEDLVDLEIIELPHISSQIRTSNLLDVSEGVPGSYIGSNGATSSNSNDVLGPFISVTPGQDIYYTGTIGATNSSSINRRLHVYDSTQRWIKQISFAGSLRVGDNWSTHGTVPANGAYIRVSWGVNDTNVMLSVGAPTKYEPYYITPFGVISSASFILADNEDYENAITYTVNVPAAAGDLYGFRYNPIQGKLYTTMGHISSYNGETLPDGEWISDRDVYEEGTTPSIGAQVIYPLDEEDVEEYDITPLTVPLFYHINYLKTETGLITRFVYYAETLSVTHLTIQDGATFGETDFFESDIQRWNHAADNIDLKADINSPTFTGTPSATTPALTVNSNRIATTAYTNNMFNSMVAPVEPTPTGSSNNYSAGQFLILQGKLYKVTQPIAQNSALVVGTNITETNVTDQFGNYYTMDTIDDMFDAIDVDHLTSILWEDLVDLRDNSELVPGMFYRITDYNFITTKLNIQSGNHQFDIVLLALSENMLSENAHACKHNGDHYFEREVTEGGIEWLYTIYVDDYAENYGDEPVGHADDIHSTDVFCNYTYDISPVTGDEVPVLFKTDGQEYSIDDPDYEDAYFYKGTYDLDGNEYDLWAKYEQQDGEWVFMQQYALTPIVVEDGELIVSPIPSTKTVPVNMNAWELKYCLDNDKELFNWAETDGKGVIYYLKDEFGNEAPYDFKNVLFRRKNITRVSSNDLSIFTQGENSHLGLLSNYGITCGDNNYYYYTFDTPFNAGNDSSLFGDSAYNTIKPYILDGQRIINNIVLGIANNNTIGSNCYDLTLWGTVGENNLTYNCSNLLVVGLSQTIMTYVRSTTFFSLGSTTFGSGCFDNIGSMLTNSEIGDGCNNNSFGTGNMGIKMGNGCSNNTFGTFNYNNTFESGVANCNLGNYVSYCEFGIAAVDITLPNYVRYCKFEPDIHKIKFTTSGGSTSRYIQYVTVCRGISNLTVAPPRNTAYEQIYYKTGRIETAV